MNDERLAELKRRAERAQVLADEIELLDQVTARFSGARCTLRDLNTNSDLLAGELLRQVVSVGIQQAIAAKESELERLLGIVGMVSEVTNG